ncbi:Alpha/Beta hydrolase protein [Pseudomassariella vexata]|uniref:Alpha/Beta hydrolase protein n=1 Tax=Pseudomassariella vexata TaxID=1141098 RepID=A0A1Y2EFZ5_9PEZI|nr:Alpha/Beta hydrolase protein [Pseudomassariella vexata]ORY70489.1 Alpha/Beta hydrolase protein [Pseudomassariella vexata]
MAASCGEPHPAFKDAVEESLSKRDTELETYDHVEERRKRQELSAICEQSLKENAEVSITEHQVEAPRQDDEGRKIIVTVVRPAGVEEIPSNRPCIFFIHGGAMVGSTRFAGLDVNGPLWVEKFNAITISVEYGRAPENIGVQLATDCYFGLLWAWRERARLGIDQDRLMLYGASAGGCLAASVALMVREDLVRQRPVPKLCGLFLEAPMLDDRCETESCKAITHGPIFNGTLAKYAWGWLLGESQAKGSEVSMLESPARAVNLGELPKTYIEAGTFDPLHDEGQRFAEQINGDGGEAIFRSFPGVTHGFVAARPDIDISSEAMAERVKWIGNIFNVET